MYKHAAAGIQTILYEANTGGQMIQEVLIIYVIDLDHLVHECIKELRVQRQSKDREHMRDASFPQGGLALEREQTAMRRSKCWHADAWSTAV